MTPLRTGAHRGRARGFWALVCCTVVALVTSAAGLALPDRPPPTGPSVTEQPATEQPATEQPATEQPFTTDAKVRSTRNRESRQGQRRRRPRGDKAVVQPPPSYAVLQMNLCLSGYAGCYETAGPGAVEEEALRTITAREPDAVTLNEACSADVRHIAEQAGYHFRFAPVRFEGRALQCISPGGRGVFGNAVMTRSAIDSSDHRPFAAQAGSEERRWLCVRSAREFDVCTTHLSTRGTTAGRAANDAQCGEFADVLAARAGDGLVIAAGDMNRVGTCAPWGARSSSDVEAEQLPGIQHAYVSHGAGRASHVDVVPAVHTDHDFLSVRMLLDEQK